MIGITKDGKWLYYDGPIDKIPSGEWEEIALKDGTRSIADRVSLFDNIIVAKITHAALKRPQRTKKAKR